MKTKTRKPRLWGKTRLKMPKPVPAKKDKGFSLRLIGEADSRFAVVKAMRRRLEELKRDAGVDTVSKEWLAARAVFLVGYLESQELDALEGKQIDWRQYLMATRSLTDVLNRLGLEREAKSAQRLNEYIEQRGKGK
jgi:hypothetical protein